MGSSTISVGKGTNPLRKVASARMLQQATDGQKNVTHLLMRTVSNCYVHDLFLFTNEILFVNIFHLYFTCFDNYICNS